MPLILGDTNTDIARVDCAHVTNTLPVKIIIKMPHSEKSIQ